MSSTNSDNFISSFSRFDSLHFFLLLVLARTFSAVLNEGGESQHLCVAPDLRAKSFSFHFICCDVRLWLVTYSVYSVMACSFVVVAVKN